MPRTGEEEEGADTKGLTSLCGCGWWFGVPQFYFPRPQHGKGFSTTKNMNSKRAREKKHEEEKASKALSGGTMVVVEGEDTTKDTRDEIELQWFRLYRGIKRYEQIASILVELAPLKVFDPRDIWNQHRKQQSQGQEDSSKTEEEKKKSGHGKKQISKADLIKQKNEARMQTVAAKRDEEKLSTLRSKARQDVKLETETGKLLLLLELLKTAVREQNVVDVLDTVWEVEDVVKELGEQETASLLKKHSDVLTIARKIRNDRDQLGKLNLVDFQLLEMSDRLPPLNAHALSGKFKLDEWQVKVLQLIEDRKSVLVTAPTSSGKTVLSTFVCSIGSRVLFVVPTEPLAWQVAAMLRALKLGICLVVPTLNFIPPAWDVVVGTPHALESSLTKQIGFDFDFAVFDEVHSLNTKDGEALQRLILAMPSESCRFVCLSATIGNGPQLKTWLESTVGKIELVEHRARFINLQRHVWVPSNQVSPLRQLHPLACVDVKFLMEHGFHHTDMAFTPVDCYRLWQALDKVVGKPVSSLKPRKFFTSKIPGAKDLELSDLPRITLAQACEYEMALKERLQQIAKDTPELCEKVLQMLSKQTVAEEMEASSKEATSKSLVDLCFNLHSKKLTPAIVFQLDSVRCQTLFDEFLGEIEHREVDANPNFRTELVKQQRGLEKLEKAKAGAKGDKKGGNRKAGEDREDQQEDAGALAAEFGEMSSKNVDVHAPHPNFTLSPPGKAIGMGEATDIYNQLKEDLPSVGEIRHPLLRALRRGVGVYIEGLPAAYHRIVQSLAQKGALGVVFSDELLAYGVNMPFRAAVFYGDPGRHWLTPLLHQQMAGRAGRRGLDRQGHLVYAGFSPDRLRELLRGELPDVVGRFPLYPTVPLQLEMNRRYTAKGKPLDEAKMHAICRTPLAQFLLGTKVDGYYETAQSWVKHLGIMTHPRSAYSYLVPNLVWELRNFLPESVAIQFLLEPLIRKYKNAEYVEKGDKDAQLQYQIMLIFCRVCSRQEYKAVEKEGDMPTWYAPLPAPHNNEDYMDTYAEWTELLMKSQSRIDECELDYKEQLKLPVAMDQPLDNMCYSSFLRNQIDPSLPTEDQHALRARLWNVGEVLRITSNILGRSTELQTVQNLIRKCFVRIRYILDETFQRNWKN
ncbi:hypothetical protein BASA81_008287 [Batrachochytrium salamandrivorans]|nr:hypothetical protein BASA81_008287 [Batrachochytrium salamandrivorans]